MADKNVCATLNWYASRRPPKCLRRIHTLYFLTAPYRNSPWAAVFTGLWNGYNAQSSLAAGRQGSWYRKGWSED